MSSSARLPLSSAAMPLHSDSAAGGRGEQELWHGSLLRAILRVETHVVNEGSGSQRECVIREDVGVFSREKMPFLTMSRGNIK